jgi:hypothetical protein
VNLCPKCNKKCSNAVSCDICGLVFTEYETEKKEKIGRVYGLISAGELEAGKELAEQLCTAYPDSRNDLLLLLSNINRDLNITDKYQLAQELFRQGEYEQAVVLLRNIKAFAPQLEEKVITLRSRLERQGSQDEKFARAVELFELEKFAGAEELFSGITGFQQQDEVDSYLAKLGKIRNRMLADAVAALAENLFDAAAVKFDELVSSFPAAKPEVKGYLHVLAQKATIREALFEAAHLARKEGRFIEAKVIYSYLGWQYRELLPKLRPYLEEIGSRAIVSLADCDRHEIIDFAPLTVQVNENGFLIPVNLDGDSGSSDESGSRLTVIAPVMINPDPLADTVSSSVDIDGDEVADFA